MNLNYILNIKEVNFEKITKDSINVIYDKYNMVIDHICLSQNGKYLAFSGDNSRITILEYKTSINYLKLFLDIKVPSNSIKKLIFHYNNSNLLFFSSKEKNIKIYDISKDKLIFTKKIKDSDNNFFLNKFKNELVLLEKRNSNILKFYDINVDTLKLLDKNLKLNDSLIINDVEFFNNNIYILTNDIENSILIYDHDTLNLNNIIYGHKINTKKIISRNNKILSLGEDNIVNIINPNYREIDNVLYSNSQEILDLEFNNDIIILSIVGNKIHFYNSNILIYEYELNFRQSKILYNSIYNLLVIVGETGNKGIIQVINLSKS